MWKFDSMLVPIFETSAMNRLEFWNLMPEMWFFRPKWRSNRKRRKKQKQTFTNDFANGPPHYPLLSVNRSTCCESMGSKFNGSKAWGLGWGLGSRWFGPLMIDYKTNIKKTLLNNSRNDMPNQTRNFFFESKHHSLGFQDGFKKPILWDRFAVESRMMEPATLLWIFRETSTFFGIRWTWPMPTLQAANDSRVQQIHHLTQDSSDLG